MLQFRDPRKKGLNLLFSMNIYDEIYRINKAHPDKRAMSIMKDSGEELIYTYGDIFSLAEKYADNLLNAGVRPGDRVAIAAESSPLWAVSFFAICKIRCTAALIDSSLTGEDLCEFTERSDVRAAFFSENTYKRTENKRQFQFPVFNVDTCTVFPDSAEKVPDTIPLSEDTDERSACIIFSSGTTRKAAGILHFHDSLINTTKTTGALQDIDENARFLGMLPLSHIYGLFALVLGPAVTGSEVHFVESVSADSLLKAFSEYKPTILPGVPKVYDLFKTAAMRKINSKKTTKLVFEKLFPVCLNMRRKNGRLLGKYVFGSIHKTFGGELVRLFSGGAPLTKETAEFYYGLGFNILSTYGASETNVPTIGNTADCINTASCGRAYPGVELKISSDGELLIKTPLMMKGYFRDEKATAEAFTDDGWFMSGDKAEIDEKGFVTITGRMKESIVLSTGKKVSPEDLEIKYQGLKAVKDFAISGVPSDEGEYDEVHAFIVIESEAKREEAEKEISLINADVPPNMRIKKLHFVDDIPRTSLGKPKRFILKNIALSGEVKKVSEKKKPRSDKNDAEGFIKALLSEISKTPVDEINDSMKVFSDLAIDSLGAVDMAMEIEETYKINVEGSYSKEMTVRELINAVKEGKTVKAEDVSHGIYPMEKSEADYKLFSAVRSFSKFCYNINAVNEENIPSDTGFILCPNHVTKIDYLFVSTAISKERFMRLCCMAKKELFRKDIFSKKLIKVTGMVPVDRGGMNMNTMTSIREKIKAGWCVLIHPEGTRSEDGIFRKIKSGASVLSENTGVPLVPVYIAGAYELFPKSSKIMKFYDMKNKKKFDVDVVFGKPIYPEGKTVEELTEELQNAILSLQEEYGR